MRNGLLVGVPVGECGVEFGYREPPVENKREHITLAT